MGTEQAGEALVGAELGGCALWLVLDHLSNRHCWNLLCSELCARCWDAAENRPDRALPPGAYSSITYPEETLEIPYVSSSWGLLEDEAVIQRVVR